MTGWLLFLVYVLTIPIAYGIVKYMSMDKQLKYEGYELWAPAILWPFYLFFVIVVMLALAVIYPFSYLAEIIDKFVENQYEKRHKK